MTNMPENMVQCNVRHIRNKLKVCSGKYLEIDTKAFNADGRQ